MDNRDFRDRLKEHKTEPPVSAWEQMEGMLDALPKEEKKSNKRFVWWPFLLLGLLASVTFITLNMGGNNDSLLSNTTNTSDTDTSVNNASATLSEHNIKKTEGNEVTDTETNKNINSQTAYNSLAADNMKTETAASTEITLSLDNSEVAEVNNIEKNKSRSSKNTTINNSSNSKIDAKNARQEEVTIAEPSATTSQKENQPQLNNHKGFNNSKSGIQNDELASEQNEQAQISKSDNLKIIEDQSSSNPQTNSSVSDNIGELIAATSETEATEKEVVSSSDKEVISSTENEKEVNSLDYLNKEFQSLNYADYEMGESKIIKNIGPSRFYWLAGAGYAEFNNNPGMIFTAGVMYDVDRIIDLEVNTSYTFGRGSEDIAMDSITKEQQIELNLMIHLNFIKNKTHKISFDLGGGFTSYSGQRLIQSAEPSLNIRSSVGRNLQMGLSYHFSLNRNSKLGLRLGVVAYDDAIVYISSRFVQRF